MILFFHTHLIRDGSPYLVVIDTDTGECTFDNYQNSEPQKNTFHTLEDCLSALELLVAVPPASAIKEDLSVQRSTTYVHETKNGMWTKQFYLAISPVPGGPSVEEDSSSDSESESTMILEGSNAAPVSAFTKVPRGGDFAVPIPDTDDTLMEKLDKRLNRLKSEMQQLEEAKQHLAAQPDRTLSHTNPAILVASLLQALQDMKARKKKIQSKKQETRIFRQDNKQAIAKAYKQAEEEEEMQNAQPDTVMETTNVIIADMDLQALKQEYRILRARYRKFRKRLSEVNPAIEYDSSLGTETFTGSQGYSQDTSFGGSMFGSQEQDSTSNLLLPKGPCHSPSARNS